MSRLEIPVNGQILFATGDVRLWVEITLLIRDGRGNFVGRDFFVDTGTEVTTFPAYEAKRLGLYVPPRPAAVKHEQTGLEVRSGQLAFRVGGMDQTLYAVSCLFLGDPDLPPSGSGARVPRNLFQPFALTANLRFTADRDPSLGNLYGELVVEKR